MVDAAGNTIEVEEDLDCDGTPDRLCVTGAFDDAGYQTSYREDIDGDGSPETCSEADPSCR